MTTTTDPKGFDSTTLDPQALTVAMVVAPGVYARNRMFSLFEKGPMKEARRRASLLLGIVKQWTRYRVKLTFEPIDGEAGAVRLKYSIEKLTLTRELVMTQLECACLRYLACRAPLSLVAEDAADRARVDEALARLHPR
jgi:hypothetical protein